MVDATMTAYKCLESAYMNQPGSPNHLKEHFDARTSLERHVLKEFARENIQKPKGKKRAQSVARVRSHTMSGALAD